MSGTEDETLATLWSEFAREVFTPGSTSRGALGTQLTFYHGAACLLDIVKSAAGPGLIDGQALRDKLIELDAELVHFRDYVGPALQAAYFAETQDPMGLDLGPDSRLVN